MVGATRYALYQGHLPATRIDETTESVVERSVIIQYNMRYSQQFQFVAGNLVKMLPRVSDLQ